MFNKAKFLHNLSSLLHGHAKVCPHRWQRSHFSINNCPQSTHTLVLVLFGGFVKPDLKPCPLIPGRLKGSCRKSVLRVTVLFTEKWALPVGSFQFISHKNDQGERDCPSCALKSGCGNTGLVLALVRAGNIRWERWEPFSQLFAKSALGKPYISYFSGKQISVFFAFPENCFSDGSDNYKIIIL